MVSIPLSLNLQLSCHYHPSLSLNLQLSRHYHPSLSLNLQLSCHYHPSVQVFARRIATVSISQPCITHAIIRLITSPSNHFENCFSTWDLTLPSCMEDSNAKTVPIKGTKSVTWQISSKKYVGTERWLFSLCFRVIALTTAVILWRISHW